MLTNESAIVQQQMGLFLNSVRSQLMDAVSMSGGADNEKDGVIARA